MRAVPVRMRSSPHQTALRTASPHRNRAWSVRNNGHTRMPWSRSAVARCVPSGEKAGGSAASWRRPRRRPRAPSAGRICTTPKPPATATRSHAGCSTGGVGCSGRHATVPRCAAQLTVLLPPRNVPFGLQWASQPVGDSVKAVPPSGVHAAVCTRLLEANGNGTSAFSVGDHHEAVSAASTMSTAAGSVPRGPGRRWSERTPAATAVSDVVRTPSAVICTARSQCDVGAAFAPTCGPLPSRNTSSVSHAAAVTAAAGAATSRVSPAASTSTAAPAPPASNQ